MAELQQDRMGKPAKLICESDNEKSSVIQEEGAVRDRINDSFPKTTTGTRYRNGSATNIR